MCWIEPKISTTDPTSPYLLVFTKDKKIRVGYLHTKTIEKEEIGKIEFPFYLFDDGQRILGNDIYFWFAVPEIPHNQPDRSKREDLERGCGTQNTGDKSVREVQ